jgi:hypothetical protein
MKSIKFLTIANFATIFAIAIARMTQLGRGYYDWKNAPVPSEDGSWTHTEGWGSSAKTNSVNATEVEKIFTAKLDGAYAERAYMALMGLFALALKGAKVALIQIKEESGLPFDAAGWTVFAVEGPGGNLLPMFHINPEDLPGEQLGDLCNIIYPGTPEATATAWDPTAQGGGKPQEFAYLFELLTK